MLDPHAIDVLTQYGLHQHVTGQTHISGNTLDLILSRDEQIFEQLVSMLAVESMCFSDHHLLTCHLGVPLLQPVTMTYTYQSLRKIHTAAFSADILQSRLYGELELDADGYVDAEVKQVLDIHAPLRTGRSRCGQRDSRHLLDEARQAKQQCRRLERRYVEPAYSQTRRLISRPVQLHVRASSSHEPITSSQNSTKQPAMFAPPGERHRDCCTEDTRSCTTTPSARS